jgi:hypothetical protein
MRFKMYSSRFTFGLIIILFLTIGLNSNDNPELSKDQRFKNFLVYNSFKYLAEPTAEGFLLKRNTVNNYCSDKNIEIKLINNEWRLFEFETQEELADYNECFLSFKGVLKSRMNRVSIYPIYEFPEYKKTTSIEEIEGWNECKRLKESIECERSIHDIPIKITLDLFEDIIYYVSYSVYTNKTSRTENIKNRNKLVTLLKKSFPKVLNYNEDKKFNLEEDNSPNPRLINLLEMILENKINQKIVFISIIKSNNEPDIISISLTQENP